MDTVFIGPGEDTWPRFLDDFACGRPQARYTSTVRTLEGLPPVRRDLIKRHLYLVPNSIVVKSVLQPRLLEAAVESGLRSLFVGFEGVLSGLGRIKARAVTTEEAGSSDVKTSSEPVRFRSGRRQPQPPATRPRVVDTV